MTSRMYFDPVAFADSLDGDSPKLNDDFPNDFSELDTGLLNDDVGSTLDPVYINDDFDASLLLVVTGAPPNDMPVPNPPNVVMGAPNGELLKLKDDGDVNVEPYP